MKFINWDERATLTIRRVHMATVTVSISLILDLETLRYIQHYQAYSQYVLQG